MTSTSTCASRAQRLGISVSTALSLGHLSREQLVVHYAGLGYNTKEIHAFLTDVHGITISMRHLYRLRKKLGVNAREAESPLPVIETAIREELNGAGVLIGYRRMWLRLKAKYRLSVRRDTVMALLALMDPHGTRQRKKRRMERRVYCSMGPNFMWHCDGYDKLKPFGIAIHGCIDGYSRRIMWLSASQSNNRPDYVAKLFINCVRNVGGCPRILRTDLGTENSIIAVIQPALRHSGNDAFARDKSHRYGKSHSNQRIEALWCQLRKSVMDWWISFFKDFQRDGHFNSAVYYHMDAVRYAFGPLIQQELQQFANEWNNHRIRRSNMAEVPGGIPEVLFHMPHLCGVTDELSPVPANLVDEIEQEVTNTPTLVDPTFKALADRIVSVLGIPQPRNAGEASWQYFGIIQSLESMA